jgi:hypothetical protein
MSAIANIPKGAALTAGSKLPAAFGNFIAFEPWARSIVFNEEYTEPDPNFISRMLALQSIVADTIAEVWQAAGVKKLQELLANVPGATTGPREITDLYVAKSDFETGNPTYVIITWTDLELGTTQKVTTGATNIQATLIGLLKHGVWPIRCQVKRGDSKDKGDRYLMSMLPPD